MRARGARSGLRRLPSKAQIVRAVVILAVALPLGWLVFSQGLAAATRSVRPDIALGRQPWDARALAVSAERLVSQNPGNATTRAEARALAARAAGRDPTVVVALRVLGLVASIDRQDARARQFFHMSERRSRRDLATQLWLIEERVTRNDIQGALVHYDIALRTSAQSFDILLPILVAATSESSINGPLTDFLKRNPPWREAFLARLVTAPPDPAKTVELLRAIGAGRTPHERQLLRDLLARLVDGRRLAEAVRLYRDVMEPQRGPAQLALPIRNASFAQPIETPPFDWWLSGEGELLAERQTQAGLGDGAVLAIRASSGAGGDTARQFLLLRPGDYRLSLASGRLGEVAPAQITVRVICANQAQTALLSLQPALNGQRQSATLRVPAGCPGQWLQIGVATSFEPDDRGAWLDAIEIQPGGGRGA